jgi:hypothetical protein
VETRASGYVFKFCASGVVSRGTVGVGSHSNVLCARTRFPRYHGRRVLFLGFALPDSFSAVPRALGPVFMFYAPGLVLSGTEDVGSRFYVLCARTHFRRNRGVGTHFHVLRVRTCFRRYRGRRVLFSCFACPYSFSAVSRASTPILIFCAPGLIFGGTAGVGSRFHVLRADTRFRRYRGHRVTFSCFTLPDSFLAVLTASGSVFMFYA